LMKINAHHRYEAGIFLGFSSSVRTSRSDPARDGGSYMACREGLPLASHLLLQQ
jgi:hypothetical protein